MLYVGMTEDGSKVFFTTPDALLDDDTDTSTDLYQADVDAEGKVDLSLLSVGSAAGQSDGCSPQSNGAGPHWNAVGATADCGVVGFAGGAGISVGAGVAYFLSPEKLDGSGVQDEPNLFVTRPGEEPRFVATLDPDDPAIRNAVRDNEASGSGDIQVTPDGEFAVFASSASLTGFPNGGAFEIYRSATPSTLDCVSCAPSGAAPSGDAVLSARGLNLTDDGAVFFTSPDQLVLRDSNKRKDAYEWEGGTPQLISTGTSPGDSGLVTVSADGTDAYFFTRQVLVPTDENGGALKIYDARAGGGFPFDPPSLPCQASDECHGAGSRPAPPPDIGTYKGTGGNLQPSHQKKKKKHHRKKKTKHSKKKKQRRGSSRNA